MVHRWKRIDTENSPFRICVHLSSSVDNTEMSHGPDYDEP